MASTRSAARRYGQLLLALLGQLGLTLEGLAQSVRRRLAQADILDFPALLQAVERLDRVLDRRRRVDAVKVKQVGRRAETLDRAFVVAENVVWLVGDALVLLLLEVKLGSARTRRDSGNTHVPPALGADKHLLPRARVLAEEPPKKRLVVSEAVDDGGVPKGTSQIEGFLEHLQRLVVVCLAVRARERHGSVSEHRCSGEQTRTYPKPGLGT